MNLVEQFAHCPPDPGPSAPPKRSTHSLYYIRAPNEVACVCAVPVRSEMRWEYTHGDRASIVTCGINLIENWINKYPKWNIQWNIMRVLIGLFRLPMTVLCSALFRMQMNYCCCRFFRSSATINIKWARTLYGKAAAANLANWHGHRAYKRTSRTTSYTHSTFACAKRCLTFWHTNFSLPPDKIAQYSCALFHHRWSSSLLPRSRCMYGNQWISSLCTKLAWFAGVSVLRARPHMCRSATQENVRSFG